MDILFCDFDRENIDVTAAHVINELIERFNKENGTNVFPTYTGVVGEPKK